MPFLGKARKGTEYGVRSPPITGGEVLTLLSCNRGTFGKGDEAEFGIRPRDVHIKILVMVLVLSHTNKDHWLARCHMGTEIE